MVSQQTKSKSYTDSRRRARPSKVTVGAKVRIRKPFHVGKGEREFTDPLCVQQQTGQSTFILSDGKKMECKLCPNNVEDLQMTGEDIGHTGSPDISPRETEQREKRSPLWAKDYVMS